MSTRLGTNVVLILMLAVAAWLLFELAGEATRFALNPYNDSGRLRPSQSG